MHAVHTTPGFVIDSRPYGEADKLLSIFTKDFGLVSASARGIRLEKSKLRYFCQDRSFGEFSLVRGKEFWRLTSANSLCHPRESGDPCLTTNRMDSRLHGNDTKADELLARIATLLKRLVQGEEPHPELFDCLKSLNVFLASNEALGEDQLKALESLSVLRILALLGYIGNDEGLNGYATDFSLSLEMLSDAAKRRTAINAHINKALKESHL